MLCWDEESAPGQTCGDADEECMNLESKELLAFTAGLHGLDPWKAITVACCWPSNEVGNEDELVKYALRDTE